MDGLKISWPSSLQFRLSFALAVAMLMAAIAIGGIGFYSAFHDAYALQDDMLRDIADMVDTNNLSIRQGVGLSRSGSEDSEAHVVVQMIDPSSRVSDRFRDTTSAVTFPGNLNSGLQTVQIRDNDWRIFVRPLTNGKLLAVGQQTDVRDDIAEHAGMNTLMLILILIPLLIVMLIAVLRLMLAPLAKLAYQLNTRRADDTRVLQETNLPDELRPFIIAINAMLNRQHAAFEQQRRFVADAAHELRSPLTALSLQTQNLAVHDLPEVARDQLNEFRRGLNRANALIEQLTSLARAQLIIADPRKAIALQDIVRVIFEEQIEFSAAKNIELGFEQTSQLSVVADEINLMTAIRNLVDNAIRYTQPGGRVDVIVFEENNAAVVEVQDTGPGIALDQQLRVFDRFYRILGSGQSGSGLGLSIVKNIVENLQGEISIRSSCAADNHFLIVQLRLPLIPKP